MIWTGRVLGQPASTVIFSARGDLLIANMATQPQARDAGTTRSGSWGAATCCATSIPRSFGRKVIPSFRSPCRNRGRRPARRIRPTRSTCSCSYTPKAQSQAGGAKAMKDGDPGLTSRRRTCPTSRAGGPPAAPARRRGGSGSTTESRTRNRPEHLQEAGRPAGGSPRRRDAVGADLVVLIAEYTKQEIDDTSCGNSFLMETPRTLSKAPPSPSCLAAAPTGR